MKEARFWTEEEDGKVSCHLCNQYCTIAEGKRGFCTVRENRDGCLYSLVYGRTIARNVDPIEKKPLYHFQPNTRSYSIATPGCNFRCDFCQNWRISQTSLDTTFDHLPEVTPEEIVEDAVEKGCSSIAHTYTEPTIFMEYALDVAELSREQGLKNVFVTNGFMTPRALEAMDGLIQGANVDLKAFSEDFYRERCRAELQPVLNTIRQMHEMGIHVEVTTLVVPGQNDSEEELRNIAGFIAEVSPDIPWHISRFHPDYKQRDSQATPAGTMQRALHIARDEGLHYPFLGNIALGEGRDSKCPYCGEVVISRGGLFGASVKLDDGACHACGKELAIVTD